MKSESDEIVEKIQPNSGESNGSFRLMAWTPIPSLLTEQLISGVESRRPKGPQPDDPILLQLEQPLLPVIACKMIKEGHLEVGNGDLHLISVVLPKVLRQTTVGPSAIPAIRLMKEASS